MPRPKEPLIRPADVVARALELIDRDGLDGFNMRKLAQELGVNPASLYYHFHDKNEILKRVCLRVLDEGRVLAPLRNDAPWHDFVKKAVGRYRQALMRHPNIAPLMTAGWPLGHVGSLRHRGIAKLLADGVPEKYVNPIIDSINNLAYGSAMLNLERYDEQQEVGAAQASDTVVLPKASRMPQRTPDRLFEMQLEALLEGWMVILRREQADAVRFAVEHESPQRQRNSGT